LVTTLFEELAGGSRLSSATLDPTSSQASSPYADQH
jgi:hypothetical protein